MLLLVDAVFLQCSLAFSTQLLISTGAIGGTSHALRSDFELGQSPEFHKAFFD